MLTGLVCLSPQASSRTISIIRVFLLIAFAASQVPPSASMRRLYLYDPGGEQKQNRGHNTESWDISRIEVTMSKKKDNIIQSKQAF